jgi:voltage-gated potassium channel
MGYKSLKKRCYQVLEKGAKDDLLSRRVDIFIVTLIFLNVTSVILESVKWMRTDYGMYFRMFEWFSIGIFSIEYLLRIWSITEKPKFSKPILGRLSYLFSFYSLIDLMAVLPAYLPFFIATDFRIVRAIRLVRLFRLLKLSRYNKAFKQIKRVVENSREELVVSLFAVLTLLVIASSLMFFVENEVQPEAFSSIPATMWWGVATLTTVGYGDIYPVTDLGRLLAGVMAILGIGIFALPAGILANGFAAPSPSENSEGENKRKSTCPNCGCEH